VYIGAGLNYLMPDGAWGNYNQNSPGFKLEFANKNYCKLWYGIRFDYNPLTKSNGVINTFEREVGLSAEVKFAPFTNDCYDNKIIPYIEGILGLSSINASDTFKNTGSNLGFGGGVGVGFAYNFKILQKCWMLELDGLFFAPNSIIRDDNRDNLQGFNVGITLSVGL